MHHGQLCSPLVALFEVRLVEIYVLAAWVLVGFYFLILSFYDCGGGG